MGAFGTASVFAYGRMLAMGCAPFLVALHFDFVFCVVSSFGASVGLGRSPRTLRYLFTEFFAHYAPSQCWRGESATSLSVTDAWAVRCQ